MTQNQTVTQIVTQALAAVPTPPTAVPAVAVQSAVVTFQGVTVTVTRLTDDPKTKGDDWRLAATLAYITTSPIPIVYEEKFVGTYDQAVAKASDRVKELASLKAAHDAVHIRINDMSAGKT